MKTNLRTTQSNPGVPYAPPRRVANAPPLVFTGRNDYTPRVVRAANNDYAPHALLAARNAAAAAVPAVFAGPNDYIPRGVRAAAAPVVRAGRYADAARVARVVVDVERVTRAARAARLAAGADRLAVNEGLAARDACAVQRDALLNVDNPEGRLNATRITEFANQMTARAVQAANRALAAHRIALTAAAEVKQ